MVPQGRHSDVYLENLTLVAHLRKEFMKHVANCYSAGLLDPGFAQKRAVERLKTRHEWWEDEIDC